MLLTSSPYVPFNTLEEGLLSGDGNNYITIRGSGAQLNNVNTSDPRILAKLKDVYRKDYVNFVGNFSSAISIMEQKPGAFTITFLSHRVSSRKLLMSIRVDSAVLQVK
jgi:hypothetical protein